MKYNKRITIKSISLQLTVAAACIIIKYITRNTFQAPELFSTIGTV